MFLDERKRKLLAIVSSLLIHAIIFLLLGYPFVEHLLQLTDNTTEISIVQGVTSVGSKQSPVDAAVKRRAVENENGADKIQLRDLLPVRVAKSSGLDSSGGGSVDKGDVYEFMDSTDIDKSNKFVPFIVGLWRKIDNSLDYPDDCC
jgi:hypothetical protein